ncbi:sigma factor-like helix-turn-helix DNA-binding protein [Sutcliffiella horikoshii]|uniref:sigma factor-like helix-turn-helix DNA-binding protein n=1 Tax=Sutcliffiella horikoshii TaxID=79883 RepID=UPI001F1DF006|nr:sigma factor-like helix-turn-helix DNA-binding protein [Sutcliffiella horikoshii]MCG1023454.1 hypothetical protein [Sutcliffiella horikoshii]
MQDYIKLPTIVDKIEEIQSERIRKFIKQCKIEGNKLSIDYFRALFQSNRAEFMVLMDELAIRGFTFHTVKSNNLLPNYSDKLSSFLEVTSDGVAYKNLDLKLLGIVGMFNRFNVESDLFFHKIPLQRFTHLNASINLDIVKKEFEKVGFSIVGDTNEDTDQGASSPIVYKDDELSETTVVKDEKGNYGFTVDHIFELNKYLSFKRYCRKQQIKFIHEITEEDIENYAQSNGVGMKKVTDVREMLEEINYCLSTRTFKGRSDLPNQEEPALVSKYSGSVPVVEVFAENKFNIFRNYCSINNLETVGDIQSVHIDNFRKTPGVGNKRFKEVLEVMEEYETGKWQDQKVDFTICELYEDLKQLKVIHILEAFKFEVKTESPITLGELNGKKRVEIIDFDSEIIMNLQRKLTNVIKPENVGEKLSKELKDNEYKIIKFRFEEKLTLEETGLHFSVTRERIRQIEGKTLKKIKRILDNISFYTVVSLVSQTKTYISKDELLHVIGRENSFLIEILQQEHTKIIYFEKLDAFFFNSEKKMKFEALDEFFEDLPTIFSLEDYKSLLEETLEEIGVEEPSTSLIEKLIENYGFNRYGELYSRTKFSLPNVLEILFKDYIKKPLRIEEEEVELLRKLAFKHLNYKIESSVRGIDARLRDCPNIMLVDRSTFKWFDPEKFDQSIITKVDEYLSERLDEVNVVNIEEVFEKFKVELSFIEVRTKLHLYSLVRYFLDEKYVIGKGNTLNIFKDNTDKLSVEESLLKAINSLGGYCDKNQLQEKLLWQMYKIDLGISASRSILPWGRNQVISFERIGLTDVEIEGLISITKAMLKDGFTTTGILYREIMFSPSLSQIISQKGVDDPWKLSSILKIIMPELRGHTNFIYMEGSTFTSIEEVVVHHFQEETARKELHTFVVEFGYKDVMASNILKRLLDRELFVEIDIDKLYPGNKFQISEDAVHELLKLVEEFQGQSAYVPLSKIRGYKRRLPQIDYRWNPYLMKTILLKNGYRQITKIMSDYRYDKIVLVKEESPLKSFEELVHYVLKNKYEGNMHQSQVYDFLVEVGILREQESVYNKVLPHELKDVDNLVNVDSLGIVTLR